ncbi:MAG: GIY-YIG nuclease family protein [Parcubacteria group bacterium]|nr:GIY-YIG nuclease family protein [Candidatus Liptonbacteria bacterium]MBI3020082.1 GIY-YIG nuclease family protein [Parcubacteria group bacterium]
MFFYVYILESRITGEWYFGFTKDLRRRLKEHNDGASFSTKSACPWRIIYYEASLDKRDAERREKYLKTTQGRRMIRRRLWYYIRTAP